MTSRERWVYASSAEGPAPLALSLSEVLVHVVVASLLALISWLEPVTCCLPLGQSPPQHWPAWPHLHSPQLLWKQFDSTGPSALQPPYIMAAFQVGALARLSAAPASLLDATGTRGQPAAQPWALLLPDSTLLPRWCGSAAWSSPRGSHFPESWTRTRSLEPCLPSFFLV